MIRYTPQVTHIVSDPDVDEPALLKFLGVSSREELAENVRDRGVSYEWVSTCIRVSVNQVHELGRGGHFLPCIDKTFWS